MGMLVDGVWHDVWYDTDRHAGRFVRPETAFQDWVRADGSTPYAPEPGRYHLYVSLACPWAHRTLIFRKLKALEDVIDVSIVDAHMGDKGWAFGGDGTADRVNGCRHLSDVYVKARADYTGRVTVPVLWDRQQGTIVSNESADIIRMFNAEFDAHGDASVDFYPAGLRADIDRINDFVYDRINNGVYKAGFATTQAAYDEAVAALFTALDALEERLSGQGYLVGDRPTEADWRLFTTLVRFDPVYVGHFKCNLKRLVDYPNLWAYTRRLYQVPGVRETVNFEHIKRHYYTSHPTINPTSIVPAGPSIDFDRPVTPAGRTSQRGV